MNIAHDNLERIRSPSDKFTVHNSALLVSCDQSGVQGSSMESHRCEECKTEMQNGGCTLEKLGILQLHLRLECLCEPMTMVTTDTGKHNGGMLTATVAIFATKGPREIHENLEFESHSYPRT